MVWVHRTDTYRNDPTPYEPDTSIKANRDPDPRFRTGGIRVLGNYGLNHHHPTTAAGGGSGGCGDFHRLSWMIAATVEVALTVLVSSHHVSWTPSFFPIGSSTSSWLWIRSSSSPIPSSSLAHRYINLWKQPFHTKFSFILHSKIYKLATFIWSMSEFM